MKILLAHNRYRSNSPSGEDMVFEAQRGLLEERGHSVVSFERRSDDIATFSLAEKFALPFRQMWSRKTHRELLDLLRAEKPDVAHFHNLSPLISPSAYYACREAGVPVVQTLHNYRLACPNGLLFREGEVCEACLGRPVAWAGIVHGCYRSSRAATTAVAAMTTLHRTVGTWRRLVDAYVSLTEFSRRKLVAAGLPAEKLRVVPNFVAPDPGETTEVGTYALFVGRFSEEKGILPLLAAWKLIDEIPLKIIGDGPQAEAVKQRVRGLRSAEAIGRCLRQEVLDHMRRARLVIVPSLAYESFGMVICEAFACGVPVIASDVGAAAELVADGRTGLRFDPSDLADLAAKVARLWQQPGVISRMGSQARREYEERYTPQRHYETLIDVYQRCIDGKRAG